MKKKNWLLLSFVLLFSLFLAACSSESVQNDSADNGSEGSEETGEESASTSEQELNLTARSEIPTMDPSMATDTIAFQWIGETREGLYRLTEDSQITEGVAIDHKVSEDALTWTFELRKSEWSNGDPVTAHDFVYSWRRAINPKTGSEYGPYMMSGVIKNATEISEGEAPIADLGVTAKDDYTLVVELENPVPYFESLTVFGTFAPLNQDFVEEQGEDFALEPENMLANGPFIMTEWNHGGNWTVEKNDTYWDKKAVKLARINTDVVKEVSTAVNLYETGELDRVDLTASFVDEYSTNEDFRVVEKPYMYFLKMNQENEVLANINARKAIQHAINKQGLVDVILNNGSLAANGFMPANFVKHPESKEDFRELNGDLVTPDKETAQKFWAKALDELGKETVTLELVGDDTDTVKNTTSYYKNQLEKTLDGLTIDVKNVPFKERVRLGTEMEYQLLSATWGPDYLDANTYMNLFVTDGPNNKTGYSSKEYDKLIKKAGDELAQKPVERFEAFLEAEKILVEEDAVISPLYQNAKALLWNKDMKNVIVNPIGPEFEYKWAYVE